MKIKKLASKFIAINLIALLAIPQSAMAGIITVTTAVDEAYDSGDLATEEADGTGLSLREAIETLNAGGVDVSETITFDTAAMGTDTIEITRTTGPCKGDLVTQVSGITIDGDLDSNGTPDITIDGAGDERAGRVFAFKTSDITTNLNGLIIQNGESTQDGGGICLNKGNLNLSNCIVQNNSTDSSGGGIHMNAGTNLNMENTAILNNTAKMSGGGITNDNGTLTISGSLISNNSVTGTGGSFGKGGGIAMKVGGISTIANSTISGNNASQEGGGVYISDGTININNSTIAFNTSDNDNDSSGDGGGIYNNGSNTVNLFHTIISDNTNGLGVSASPSDLYGTIITQGYNLIKDALTAGTLVDGVGGDQVGVDPLLTALSDNGGLTQTHEIPFNSPAINAGDPAYSGELTIDQRGTGFIREAQTTIDIGAYENQTGNAIIVTTVTDETFDGGDLSAETADGTGLSLREAIAVANAGENVGFDSEISGGTITLTNGEIALNKALIIDGDINEDDKADITISGGGASRAMNITADATLISITIDNSNAGTGNGGAILNTANLTIYDSTISNSSAKFGGGIRTSTGTVNLERVTFNGNTAASAGGAIYNLNGNLNLTNSTISGNDTTTNGGGIFNSGSSSNMYIKNSTIAYNICDSDNDNTGEGCGVYNSTSGTTYVENSIIAENTESAAGGSVPNQTFYLAPGSITSDGYNLIGLGSSMGFTDGTNNDQVTVASDIIALADNGGATQTHALDESSLAVNAGDPSYSGGLTTDQTGNTRQYNTIDIGSYEIQTTPNNPPTASDKSITITEDANFTFGDKDFNYSDSDTDAMASIKITTLPTAGSLQLSGTDVALNAVIAKSDISSGNLKFVPKENGNGTPYSTFQFSVNDGTDDSVSSYTATVNVTPVQDTITVTTTEDETYDGGTIDEEESDGDGLSLREAVGGAGGGDIIEFDSPGMSITLINGEITLGLSGLMIEGSTGTTVSGNDVSQIFHISADTTINSVALKNAKQIGDEGGAVHIETGNIVNMTDVSITDSVAEYGGGILNYGTLTLTRVTISGNQAQGGHGGGIFSSNILTLINSTISGNTADIDGGGIFGCPLGTSVTSNNSTIAYNIADNDNDGEGSGGGIFRDGGTAVTLYHTIVSDNTKGSDASSTPDDLSTPVTSEGYNLISDTATAGGLTDGVNNDIIGSSANLVALADNGGSTLTHELGTDSPAVDAGDPSYSGGLTIDQRNSGREIVTIDIGSYETPLVFTATIDNTERFYENKNNKVRINYTLAEGNSTNASFAQNPTQVQYATDLAGPWTNASIYGTTTSAKSSPSGKKHNKTTEPLYWDATGVPDGDYYIRVKPHNGAGYANKYGASTTKFKIHTPTANEMMRHGKTFLEGIKQKFHFTK